MSNYLQDLYDAFYKPSMPTPTRPPTYKFNYSVAKQHPYVTEGFTHEEAFDALRNACATKPNEMFNMDGDHGYLFRHPSNGNVYHITLQD